MEKTDITAMRKELSFNEKVIKKIAGIATDEVPGVLTATGGFIAAGPSFTQKPALSQS